MTDVRTFLIDAVRGERHGFKTMKDRCRVGGSSPALLEDVTVEGDVATFLWCDPPDGTRHGWRYQFRTRGQFEAVGWRCWEDFETSEPTEPDENGVRWWGVHQWADGELIYDRGA